MNAVPRIDTPQRYPDKTPQQRARLIRAEGQLIDRFLRDGSAAVAWRCHVCRGRIDIARVQTFGARTQTTFTRGLCRTPDCLNWED